MAAMLPGRTHYLDGRTENIGRSRKCTELSIFQQKTGRFEAWIVGRMDARTQAGVSRNKTVSGCSNTFMQVLNSPVNHAVHCSPMTKHAHNPCPRHGKAALLARGDVVTRCKERCAANEINQLCQSVQSASGGITATHESKLSQYLDNSCLTPSITF